MRLAEDNLMYFLLLKIVSHFKYVSHAVHTGVESSVLLEKALQPCWLRPEVYVTIDKTIGILERDHPY